MIKTLSIDIKMKFSMTALYGTYCDRMDSDKSTFEICQTNEFRIIAKQAEAANARSQNQNAKNNLTFCDVNYMNKSS